MGYSSRFLFQPHKRGNPEGIIVRQILGYLRARGIYCGKVKTVGIRRGKVFCFDPFLLRGKNDIEAFYKDIMYAIEVKSAIGKMSKFQEQYRKAFHKPPDRIYIEAHSLQDIIDIIY